MKVQSALDRPLPRSLLAEQAVLGALILGCRPEYVASVLAMLHSGDFTGINSKVYDCIVEMFQQGVKPDLILITERLGLDGEHAAYLAGLIDDALPINVEHYAQIVKKKSLLRQKAFFGQEIRDLAMAANGDAPEVLDQINKLISAHVREEVGPKRILNFVSGAGLAAAMSEIVPWIVPGFVAQGGITELGGKVKSGKTSFALNMVGAVLDGSSFLDKPTTKTPTIYLTEQPLVSFRQAIKRANLDGRHDLLVLAHGEVRQVKWSEVAAAAADKCKSVGARLLVVDTLPQFAGLAGDSENNSGSALEAMQPLQRAAAAGIGVFLIRHERKSGGEVGDSGRGSSAFAGVVDIVLSLRRPEGNSRKTIRLLQALSRFAETPTELLVELTENGGYIALGEPREAALREAKDSIFAIVPTVESEAADMKDLVKSADVSRPTAQRAIDELLKDGMLSRIGKGKRGDPFRYFVAENRFCPTSDIHGQKQTTIQGNPPPDPTER